MNFLTFLIQSDQVYNPILFDEQTVLLRATSAGMISWLVVYIFGISCFVVLSVVAATWTLSTLNSMQTNMSQKTKIIHRKLTKNLILQVLFTINS